MASRRPIPFSGEDDLQFDDSISRSWPILNSSAQLPAHLIQPVPLEYSVPSSNLDLKTINLLSYAESEAAHEASSITMVTTEASHEASSITNVTTEASTITTVTPPAVSRSHTFVTESGYTVVLQQSARKWKATVQDNRFPGFKIPSYSANVRFSNSCSMEKLIKRGPSYQSRHVHLLSNKYDRLVYIGSLGLRGGGPLNWFGYVSCVGFGCFNDINRCGCGGECPDKYCSYHCFQYCPAHPQHICRRCDSRCPKYYACRTCHSKIYCSDCCGCYEAQRLEQLENQKKRERQEQIRKRRERERQQQIRAQQENERQEQFEAQQEKDRQEEIRKRQERERQEQIRAQQERERQEQMEAQQEKERQEQIRAAEITDHNVYTFVYDASIVQHCLAVDTITIDSDSDTESNSMSRIPSWEDVTILDELYPDFKKGRSHSICDNTDGNKVDHRKKLSDSFDVNGSILKDALEPNNTKGFDLNPLLPSIGINSFPENCTAKLPQISGHELEIDYYTKEEQLDSFMVIHHSESEEYVQSLMKQLLQNEDDSFLNGFTSQWLKIAEQYFISDQEKLLKSLIRKKTAHKYSILDVSDIISLISSTGSCGYDIVCSSLDDWLVRLKTKWLESKEGSFVNFSFKEREAIRASLARMNWGRCMMDQFIKSIQEENNLDPVVKLLNIINCHQVPDSIVLPIITSPSTHSEKSRVQGWTYSIFCHNFLRNFELPHKATLAIAQPLRPLLRSCCSYELMDKVITSNLSLINAHPTEFTKVLELLYNYQVSEKICTSAFSLLSRVKAADWEDKIDQKVISELFQDSQELTTHQLIDQISNQSSAVTTEWLTACYNEVRYSYNSNFTYLQHNWNKALVTHWAKEIKLSSIVSQPELIAVVMRAVELTHYISPRDTQILSLLTLLNPSEDTGRLAQINTGEGKSLIVAMLAAIHALQNRKVDVITTSTELSIPEVKKQMPFFNLLSLTVAENSDFLTKQEAYQCDVVYGTPGDFQADILQAEFLGQDIRGQRGFNIVIVDEVDSMLFDNRTHSVRLSEQTPGMVHLELPLAAIWVYMKWIVRHLTTLDGQTFFSAEDFTRIGKVIKLYSDLDWKSCSEKVDDKKSFIEKKTHDHLSQLLREMNDEEKFLYECYLKLEKYIKKLEDKLSTITCPEEKQKIKEQLQKHLDKLKDHPWKEHYAVLNIPKHLRDFSRSQIPYWIKSAIQAAFGYKKGAHYTVQDGRIVPVHYNETGVLQSNMVWGDGLTQFLQIKEGLRMDPEGVATNFISNVGFFQRYGNNIFGLTGTLGEKATKDFLHEVYHTDTIVIPPYKRTSIVNNAHSSYLCKELVPIVLFSETEWFQTVIKHVLSHARRHRAVLVICKFIRQVKDLAEEICKHYDSINVFTYTGEEINFVKDTIDSGEIIIATNIAGRGKDLETSSSVEDHGGMYVCVTFLPETYQVEMQNVGRTARSGKKGMAQLIICDPLTSDMDTIKLLRHEKEVADTSKATHDAQKMLLQDILFRDFCSLENEFFPTYRACELDRKWVKLGMDYKKYRNQKLSPDKLDEFVNEKIAGLKAEIKDQINMKSKTEKTAEFFDRCWQRYDSAARLRFESDFKCKVLNDFCDSKSYLPEELINCLRQEREFIINKTDLAKAYDWDLFNRKGFEEQWGFWLKGQHFEGEDISLEEARERFFDNFVTPSKTRAREDQLVRNPYFYVLKGNGYLVQGKLDLSIACYDRAIEMDPDFSVNALYNKAQALLSHDENQGDRQICALKSLEQAKEIIHSISKPNILSFTTLLALDGLKVLTSEHVQHQLDLLSQQETYINQACKMIEEALKKDHHVKLTTQLLSETLHSSHQSDYLPAIREAAINGFTHVFTVNREQPIPWRTVMGIALLNIAQITAGALIIANTGSMLGYNLIYDGAYEIITSIKSAISGNFDWGVCAMNKCTALVTSITSSGIKGIKDSIQVISQTAKSMVAGVSDSKKGIQLAIRTVGAALARGAVSECFTAACEWSADKLVLEELTKMVQEKVQERVMQALLNNPLVVKALESDVKNKNNLWQDRFIEEGLTLLKNQNNDFQRVIKESKKLGKELNINKAIPLEQVVGIGKVLLELTSYTDNFIKKLDEKIASHQLEVESCVQKMNSTESTHQAESTAHAPDIDLEEEDIPNDTAGDGTSYSSKIEPVENSVRETYSNGGPSSPQFIADAFKVQISNTVINSVKAVILKPIFGSITNKASERIAEIEKINSDLRKEVRAASERSYYSYKSVLAEKRKNTDETIRRIESTRKRVDRLKKDVPLGIDDLASAAEVGNAPIYVFDKETGRLMEIIGDSLPGKPCLLLHKQTDGPAQGLWEPMNPNITVQSSGANNGLLDAVFAQFDQQKKEALQNVHGLKEKMIEKVMDHP